MLYGIFRLFFMLALMGSVLALIILLFKTSFRSRFSAKWHYYIWLLLLIRLIIPFAPENQFSVFNLFKPVVHLGDPQRSLSAHNNINLILIPASETPLTEVPVPAKPESPEGTKLNSNAIHISVQDIIGILWLTGALIMILSLAGANLRFSTRLRKRHQYTDKETLAILDQCRAELGIKAGIPIFLEPKAGTPFLFGLVRPRILTSKELLENLSEEEKRYIFLHELIHLKRKDILVNWITAVIKCVYWFNPIFWYAFRRIKEDCEFSCDERVLELLEPPEYRKYGQTILGLVNAGVKPLPLTCTTGMAGRKSSLKRRIYMISGFKKKTLASTFMALAITLLVGCSALTGAKTDLLPQPQVNNSEASNNESETGSDGQNSGNTENTASPAASPSDVKTEVPGNGANGSSEPLVIQDGLAYLLNSTDVSSEEIVKQVRDKLSAGQSVVYDGNGNIAGFAISGKQAVQEYQDQGITNISAEDLQMIQDQKSSVFAVVYISSTGTRNENLEQMVDKVIRYYIDKLKDKTYTGTYGDGFTWYTAAEELGRIGKPAIPYLIEKLGTADDYERALALYALLLATQQENVKVFTGGEYINVNLDFDASRHPDMVKTAMDWWDKYKSNF